MNTAGQEFAGFRLLIEAIMVLMILVIIMGIYSWVESLRWQISVETFYTLFENAVQTPNGTEIFQKNLVFKEGTIFSENELAQRAFLEGDCIKFQSVASTAYTISQDDSVIKINTNIQTDVYARCFTSEHGCEIYCEIRFGSEFPESG